MDVHARACTHTGTCIDHWLTIAWPLIDHWLTIDWLSFINNWGKPRHVELRIFDSLLIDERTDRRTDICTSRVAFVTENTEKILIKRVLPCYFFCHASVLPRCLFFHAYPLDISSFLSQHSTTAIDSILESMFSSWQFINICNNVIYVIKFSLQFSGL